MPAPDYPTLYDFETQLETCLKGILAASVPSTLSQIATTRDEATVHTPRLEIEVVGGTAGTQRIYRNNRENLVDFNGTVFIRIVTCRALPAERILHGQIRGIVRYALSAARKAITDTNLPYLVVTVLDPSSSTPRIFDDKQSDISELQYAIRFAIQPTAWPV